MRYRVGQRVARGACALLVVILSFLATMGVASGEAIHALEGVDVQTFSPGVSPDGVFSVHGADSFGHLQPYGGLFFDYMNQPLLMGRTDGSRAAVIEHRMAAHLLGGIGLGDRYQVGLALPVFLVNDGEFYGQTIGGTALGRLDLSGKASILSSHSEAMGLGVKLDLGLGTGNPENLTGHVGPLSRVQAQLLGDTRFSTGMGEAVVMANVGVMWRGDIGTRYASEIGMWRGYNARPEGPGLVYGVGATSELGTQRVTGGVELIGSADFVDPSVARSPLEVVAGVSFAATDGFSVKAGGGSGLVGGAGSPQFRAFMGMTYSPTVDSVEEVEPTVERPPIRECPDEPEGFLGPYDDEGCPITPETFTGCDNLVPEWDGPTDRWGCPVLDTDGDGFLNGDDSCPGEPAVFIEGAEPDGCPNLDVDGDGIPNLEDHCPLEPGLRVYDGCPPPAEEERAVRTEEEIELRDTVHFESDRALIKPVSYELLDQVAFVMKNNPDILLIEIAGHTDQRGDANYNRMLSEERAKAVREYLIEHGNIRPARLDARGYGATELLVQEDTDEAHAQNRRVEFRIREQGGR